ncbi:MAG: 2-amino-4-hydroxy-6-hydroxymethyldihydropteridine diphosphokinase [Saprospiraceae bacterium]|nr:2-amino-4-hydroxy-6-hydroxymethyldihydropteridine diphosphokinase [Saprospiraceae bacterium]
MAKSFKPAPKREKKDLPAAKPRPASDKKTVAARPAKPSAEAGAPVGKNFTPGKKTATARPSKAAPASKAAPGVDTGYSPIKKYINVYISLGSNMGDRRALIKDAKTRIHKSIGKIARESHLYETEAWGKTDQGAFLNQIIMINTIMTPRDLLEALTEVERGLGRERNEKWGPRTIDLDILLYGRRVIRDKGLDIPHPEMHKRNFILAPLMEIAGDLVHPILKKQIDELYMESTDPMDVVMLDE